MWSSLRVCEKRQDLKEEGVPSLVRGRLSRILTLKHRYSLKVVYDYYFKLRQNFQNFNQTCRIKKTNYLSAEGVTVR
jgi:hypothetical protein